MTLKKLLDSLKESNNNWQRFGFKSETLIF
jgi:hypothetical protein